MAKRAPVGYQICDVSCKADATRSLDFLIPRVMDCRRHDRKPIRERTFSLCAYLLLANS